MFPIRAVVDDNVDRPGVEVRQRMKLTGTNRSIGLIVLIVHVHRKRDEHDLLSSRCRDLRSLRCGRRAARRTSVLRGSSPIANATVRHTSASTNQLLEIVAFGRPGGYGGVLNTRSHSEHGREMPQR